MFVEVNRGRRGAMGNNPGINTRVHKLLHQFNGKVNKLGNSSKRN